MSVRSAAAILALMSVAVGCQSSPGPGGGSEASTSSGAPQGAPETVIDVNIAGGNVTPTNGQFQAKVKEPIELRVTSDAADELHVHSVPEHTFTVKPGPNQEFTFTVDVPGRVEVELHELDKTVAIIQVQQ